MNTLPGILAAAILVFGFCCIPCCITDKNSSLTPAEIRTAFLEHAGSIQDYRSEYRQSAPDGLVAFDWKSPGLYRMEYLNSTNPVTGTIFVANRTTAVSYNPGENAYQVQPDMQYLPEHDYQEMVQRMVRDGQFSVIDRETMNGRTLYEIEVRTEPWSTDYTTYVSSKVKAWIDPGSGLAWNITTYYPSDTVNNNIRYDKIEVNTGTPEDHFTFVPPQNSEVQCGYDSGISDSENFNPTELPTALAPGCLDCTGALLDKPVGGFNGDRLLVSLYNYPAGGGRTIDPDPHRSIDYTFYARSMKPGNVTYTLSHVPGLYATDPLPMPENISVSVDPGIFSAETGHEYISNVTVHVRPGTTFRENFWIHLHADVEGVPDAVTDDWVRLAVDDGSEMSGMGLWHFYTGGGGYCQKVIVIRQGESGSARFAVRTGELDTGNVSLGLVTAPCKVDHGPLRADERPAWPEGIHATISPDTFTGRSFASYLPDMSFTVDPAVQPGDYCFSAILRTPTGGGEYAPFTVRVIPSE
ncbi:MAG: hypothetical protein ABFC24_08415 [Methanoregulaceae archaeon]